MKKNLIFIAVCFLLSQNINAQQYPLFTNYITNRIGFNPAIAGQSECINALATHRQQWTGVNENPKTSIISAYGKIKKIPLGVGGYMFSDNAGALKRTGASGILSYAMHLDSSTFLGIGVASGYYSLQLGENSRVSDPTDPAYTAGKAGKNFPDFNAGVFFQRKSLWVGFSTPQIFEKKINFAPNSTNELKRHYFLMAGYDMPINQNMSIEPSGMLRYVENAELSYDISLKATLNKAFWLAGSWRKGDAIAAMLGVKAKSGINVYYAYDYTTSGLNAKSRGSHEFGIGMMLCKKKDRDGDGVMDDDDKCPDVPGPKENKGCPEDKDKKDELDTDKDGVPDKDDQCPNVPGPKENKGCPFADRDNDGIRDDIDKCPDIAGTLENLGCPLRDRDRDGIIDEKDPCPDEYGELSNYGCPEGKLPADFDARKFMASGGGIPTEMDARNKRIGPNSDIDGDGIPNDKDPDIDGDGIPNDKDPDMDGDGILNEDDPDMDGDGIPNDLDPDMDGDGIPNDRDSDLDGDGVPNDKDPCPRTRGKNGKGCPELAREAVNAIDFAVRNIYYDSDKAEIQPSSYDYLNRVAAWMVQHPEYQIDMQGHADSRNSSEYNMVLSKNRVNAVKSYMIQQGVPATSIKVEWFGETRPVATGNNEAAWKKNRRTEMQWRFE